MPDTRLPGCSLPRSRFRLPGAGWQLCGLLLFVGCGDPSGQVTGKVTFNQQPVGGAEMLFTATDDADMQFFGLSDESGNYQVSYRTFDGLPLGEYQVTVTRYALPGGRPLPSGEEGEMLKQDGRARPEAYTFQSTIASGENVLNYELTLGQRATPE